LGRIINFAWLTTAYYVSQYDRHALVGNNNKTKKLMIGIRAIEKTLWALEVSGQAKQP